MFTLLIAYVQTITIQVTTLLFKYVKIIFCVMWKRYFIDDAIYNKQYSSGRK